MAQTGISREPGSQGLLAMEARFDAALLAGDLAMLDRILGEKFFLNDFMGGAVGRTEFLNYLRSGALRFQGIMPHDLSFEVLGQAGIVTGWTEMKAELQGAVQEVRSRFLHVYVRESEAWKLVAAQGTLMA
jgi:uncharacterized protein DUF4440